MRVDKESTDFASESVQEERCKCNKLLCIVKGNNIEIKCNKCKRLMTIKTKGIEGIEIN